MGIHPPADDIPGRLIGKEIGLQAFEFAEQYFNKAKAPSEAGELKLFPNPTNCMVQVELDFEGEVTVKIFSSDGRLERSVLTRFIDNRSFVNLVGLADGLHVIVGYNGENERLFEEKVVVRAN